MPAPRYSTPMANEVNVAAVILTLNEGHNIKDCLERLQWVKDIVVVDSGSSDRTLEIAREYNARVFLNKTEKFIIADQRNWALQNAGITSEWVLFIDADEIVTDELRAEIVSAIKAAPPSVSAFRLCPKFMFMGKWLKHTLDFPVWHDRLLRNGAAKYTGAVWEYFDTKGEVGCIYSPYLHYGLNNGIAPWLRKHQRYAEWKAENILQQEAVSALGEGGDSSSRTGWKKRGFHNFLERFGTKVGPLSAVLRFLHYYVFRRGFLDGYSGLVYSMMMGVYQFMIYLFLLEKREKAAGRLL